MFIQTEETPNPATMKFLPSREVMGNGTLDLTNAKDAETSPLAKSLFEIEGVKGVFLGRDFVTVTKDTKKEWQVMKPSILTSIMDHFTNNRPIVNGDGVNTGQAGDAGLHITPSLETDVTKQIRELIEMKVRPAVAQDGGDIVFENFEDGIVYLKLKGSCSGCPSSTMTLKAGIENMLKHYIPEVREVRQAI